MNAVTINSLNVTIVILILINFLFIITGNSQVIPEVFNGYPDSKNTYGYVVCIELKEESTYMRHCTGSLIDPDWILTSGHCLGNNILSVSYGNRSQANTISRVNVLLQIRHPSYEQHEAMNDHQNSEIINDIGLLKVERIAMDTLGKFSLVDYTAFTGLSVTYAGYGITWREFEKMTSAEQRDKFSKWKFAPLQVADGVTVNCEITITWYPSACVHSDTSFCGMGDSGGPLLHDDTIVGVLSGYFKQFLVFVPVHTYLKWINDVKVKYKS